MHHPHASGLQKEYNDALASQKESHIRIANLFPNSKPKYFSRALGMKFKDKKLLLIR
jgi:hypothetical protein